MPERDDLMQIGMDAMQDAKDAAVSMVREARASVVNAPAFGRSLKRHERITQHLSFLNNRATMELKWDELESQFENEKGTIPRRWLDYGRLIKQELDQEEAKGLFADQQP